MTRICPHRIGERVDFATTDDPNSMWPSTSWTQVTDGRVPIASSISHPLGSTGGSETVTLTVDQMPPHSHSATGVNDGAGTRTVMGSYPFRIYQDRAANWNAYGIQDAGGGQAHDNMKPWEAVNRWERIA